MAGKSYSKQRTDHAMRIAIIAPYSTGPIRGNMTTVSRIARFLGLSGHETIILPADSLTLSQTWKSGSATSCRTSFMASTPITAARVRPA